MSFDSPLPPYNASDPNATFLSSSCLDLLLIELVPMAYRVTNELANTNGKSDDAGAKESVLQEDEERDAVFYRLESLGYRVGLGLVERYVRNASSGVHALEMGHICWHIPSEAETEVTTCHSNC